MSHNRIIINNRYYNVINLNSHTQHSECQLAINKSIEYFLEQKGREKTKRLPACAMRITFNHTHYMKLIWDSFKPITGELRLIKGELMAIYESESEARKVANALDSILHHYNTTLIKTPFDCGWLKAYLANENMGIDIVMADPHLHSFEQAENTLGKKALSDEDKKYDKRCKNAEQHISNYSLNALFQDLTAFLINNFNFKHSEEEVIGILNAAFAEFKFTVRGRHKVHSLHDMKVIHALETKSSYLRQEAHSANVLDQVAVIKQMNEDLRTAEKQRDRTVVRFDDIKKSILPVLSPLFESVAVKPEYTEFTGLDLMYSSPYELHYLKASTLPNFIENFANDICEAVCSVLSDVLTAYCAESSNYKMKLLLNELSDQLETKSFHTQYRYCVEQCAPVPS